MMRVIMRQLFTKTFFKFAASFVGIIAFALLSAFAMSAYSIISADGASGKNATAVLDGR